MFNILILGSIFFQNDDGGGGVSLFASCIQLALVVLIIAGMWRIFEKAGQPGWASIIPIYNAYVLYVEITGRPWWWIILLLIPCVNIIALVILNIDVARAFGYDIGFALGLTFLPFIFYLILGFGDATYKGPTAASGYLS